MFNTFGQLGGMRLYESPNAIKETEEPKKVHHIKRWSLNRCYHRRIQKKWNKRHGFFWVPCMYKIPQGLVYHPALKNDIMRAVDTGTSAIY